MIFDRIPGTVAMRHARTSPSQSMRSPMDRASKTFPSASCPRPVPQRRREAPAPVCRSYNRESSHAGGRQMPWLGCRSKFDWFNPTLRGSCGWKRLLDRLAFLRDPFRPLHVPDVLRALHPVNPRGLAEPSRHCLWLVVKPALPRGDFAHGRASREPCFGCRQAFPDLLCDGVKGRMLAASSSSNLQKRRRFLADEKPGDGFPSRLLKVPIQGTA